MDGVRRQWDQKKVRWNSSNTQIEDRYPPSHKLWVVWRGNQAGAGRGENLWKEEEASQEGETGEVKRRDNQKRQTSHDQRSRRALEKNKRPQIFVRPERIRIEGKVGGGAKLEMATKKGETTQGKRKGWVRVRHDDSERYFSL